MDWLSPKLLIKTKELFEKRYGRELTSEEVESIAISLASVMEVITNYLYENRKRKPNH